MENKYYAMDEKTLLKISLMASIAGTALLFIISLNLGNDDKNFQVLNLGDYSTVSGRIGKVYANENITFLTIYEDRPFTAVVIGKSYINFSEGDVVEMRGAVQDYNGKKEFVVDEIRKI